MRLDTEYIVIHCTAGGESETLDSVMATWKAKGWKNPGYHVLIEKNGKTHKLADAESIVNGVRGHNYHAYHICWMGGRDGDDRTVEQKQALMREIFYAQVLFPEAKVVGHRDLSPDLDGDGVIEPHEWVKLCPQFDVADFMKDLERLRDYKDDIINKVFWR